MYIQSSENMPAQCSMLTNVNSQYCCTFRRCQYIAIECGPIASVVFGCCWCCFGCHVKWYVTGSQLTNENDDVNITSLFSYPVKVCECVCVWLSVWRLIVPFLYVPRSWSSGSNSTRARFENDIKFVTYKMLQFEWLAFREFYLRLWWLICCYSICFWRFFCFLTWAQLCMCSAEVLQITIC